MSSLLPPKSWRRRLAITAAVLLMLYAVAGFFIVPLVARPQLETLVSDLVGKPVKIGAVSFNPFALSVSLRDVALEGDVESLPTIAFEELYGDLRGLALLRLAIVLDSLHLQAPRVQLIVDKQGSLNLAELFASDEDVEPPPDEPAADEELFPVSIASVTIREGQLVFRDEQRAEPFEIELSPINLELKNFSTRRERKGSYTLSSEIGEEGVIDWRGDLSVDPLRAQGEISVERVGARTLARYVGKALPFGVKSGTLELETKYAYDGSGEEMQLALGPGDLTVDGLELREAKDSPPFLTLPQLRVGGVEIDLQKENVSVATIQTKGARLQLWLDADGVMGPPALFGDPDPPADEGAPPAAEEEGEGWGVSIGEVTLADYGLAFEDRSVSPPFAFAVEPITAKVAKLSLDAGTKADVQADFGLPDEAKASLSGTVGVAPLAVDLDVQLKDVLLQRFQPYVAQVARIDIESGIAGSDGHLKVHADGGKPAVVEYAGSASVTELVVQDTSREEELLKWSSLAVEGLAYQSQPATLHVTEAALDQPYARIAIDKSGDLNVASLAVEPGAGRVSQPVPLESGAEALAIAIDSLAIRDGLVDFADYSIKPALDTGIHDLTGKIEGLSSDPRARSKMALEGKVDKHSPVKVSGVINPFNPMTQTDVAMKFDNVNLTLLTPYAARFAGYKIKRGKASVELDYHVENRELVAENSIVLEKLKLGEQVPGPDATSLPVKLAVALLKDGQGRIDIDLPVRGDLDDPKFSYAGILGNALFDLIKKTVASPFSALGSLTSFDSEELSNVEFMPGSAALESTQAEKLNAIGQALSERPALRLEVTGNADPEVDRAALADAELTKELKRAKRVELKAAGLPAPKKLSQIELSVDDYERLFEARYEATFGADPPRDEQGGFTAAARGALAGSLTIEDQDLRKLAQKRAAAIQDRLSKAGIEQNRVYILGVEIDVKAVDGKVRSDLALST